MRHFSSWTVRICILSALAAAAVSADEPVAPESDHSQHDTAIVAISPERLHPTVLVLPETSAFGWINYSSWDATIRFDDAILGKLVCRSPHPFRVAVDQVHAPRVPSGGFATLCSLAPGEYDYRVELLGTEKVLLGKLVVSRSSDLPAVSPLP